MPMSDLQMEHECRLAVSSGPPCNDQALPVTSLTLHTLGEAKRKTDPDSLEDPVIGPIQTMSPITVQN